jgi:transcriptional regulator with XRE-family HTH domain
MTKQNNSNEKATEKNENSQIKKRQIGAYTRKNTSETFWNLLRVENGLKIREIAEMTGFSIGMISNWFNGVAMPNENQIKEICKLFEVDYETGKNQFEVGYRRFHGRNDKTISTPPRTASNGEHEMVAEYAKPTTDDYVDEVAEVLGLNGDTDGNIKTEPDVDVYDTRTDEQQSKIDRILDYIYTTMNRDIYDEFKSMMAEFYNLDSLLDWLYQNVDRKTFCAIYKIIYSDG